MSTALHHTLDAQTDCLIARVVQQCPICGGEFFGQIRLSMQALDRAVGTMPTSVMGLEEHLKQAPHTDAQWRDAYFAFRPVDAVAKKSSGVAASAGTHGWRQVWA